MHSYRLQDWYTFTANGNTAAVVQPDDGWLNLQDYKDYQLWIDVSDIDLPSGTITIGAHHAPLRDNFMFHPSVDVITLTTSSVPGLYTLSQMFDFVAHRGTAFPLSKWLRWQLTGPGSAWSITFRIFVSVGGVGSGMVPERLVSRLTDD